jgi:hypothetical protein
VVVPGTPSGVVAGCVVVVCVVLGAVVVAAGSVVVLCVVVVEDGGVVVCARAAVEKATAAAVARQLDFNDMGDLPGSNEDHSTSRPIDGCRPIGRAFEVPDERRV